MPAAAKKDTAAGARAAALYFLDVYVYALHTGDSEELAAMCTDLSQFCTNALASAREAATGKAEYRGGDIEAHVTKTSERDTLTGAFAVDLSVNQAAVTRVRKGGAKTFPSGTRTMRAELLFGHGMWHVLTLTSVGSAK